MRQFLDRASMSFAAGAFGALVSSVALWFAGTYHLTARLGIGIAAPSLTPSWLNPRIVAGGLWGFLFLLPFVNGQWWLRGLILSLAPSAYQLLYVYPREAGQGYFGLDLGMLTPVYIIGANALWGLSAAWLLRTTGRA